MNEVDFNELEDALIELGEDCSPYDFEQCVNKFYEKNIFSFKDCNSMVWSSDLQDRYHGFDLWDGLVGKQILHHYHCYDGKWKSEANNLMNSAADRKELLNKLQALVGQHQHEFTTTNDI